MNYGYTTEKRCWIYSIITTSSLPCRGTCTGLKILMCKGKLVLLQAAQSQEGPAGEELTIVEMVFFYNEEGFMLINIKGEEIDWDYIDIGWEAKVKN